MIIWEVDYGAEGDFFATKADAKAFMRWDHDCAGSLRRHVIASGREGLVKFLNHEFGAGCGKRPGGSSDQCS